MSLLTITEMGWATGNWFIHTGGYNKRTKQNYCLCEFISLFGIKMYRALLKTRLHFAQFCVTIEWDTRGWKPDAHFLLGGQTDAGCHSAFGGWGSGGLCCKRILCRWSTFGGSVLFFGDPMSVLLVTKTYSTWQRSVNLGWPEMEEALLLQGSRC